MQNLTTKNEEARKVAVTGIGKCESTSRQSDEPPGIGANISWHGMVAGPKTPVNRRRKSKSNPETEDAPDAEQQIVVAGPPGPLSYPARTRSFRELMSNVDLWPGPGKSIPVTKKEFKYLLEGATHIRLTNLNNIREQLYGNPRVTRNIIQEQPDEMLEVSNSEW